MAYKCKHCGYVFKKTDSDLCPECFTAREDVDCTDFENKHSHSKETYSGGYDTPMSKPQFNNSPTGEKPVYKSEAMNDLYGMFSGETNRGTYQQDRRSYQTNINKRGDPNTKASKLLITIVILMFLFPILSFIIEIIIVFVRMFSNM